MVKKKNVAFNVAMGAAFLMAMSAVGPGFLTQTAAFTGQLGADFGFAILICILVDVGVQLNIWRIICVSGKKAQTLANELVPGLGYLLTALIVMGGLTFNIGNIGGVGLGFNVLFGISPENGALIGGAIALVIFLVRNALLVMDRTVQLLAVVKVLLIIFIVAISSPPVGQAALHTFVPSHIDFYSIVTIVGGTVGGYISFSGGHRLLEGGLRGKESIRYINGGALTGIGVASIIRILLFLAALAVIAEGYKLNPLNPAASIFQSAAGDFGYKFFGLILLAAGMTSTLGSTFTSVSFLDYSKFDGGDNFYHKLRPYLIAFFIVFSTAIFYFIGSPAKVLVIVGAINGLILPIALAILLVAVTKKNIMGYMYKHPLWLTIFGWVIVVFMAYAGVQSVIKGFSSIF
ncbi:NRAMP family divalent metal transporter [Sporolactobacillus kofuensis]|uniref:NRAMP family divalent metal transporter n=1 Tax=Sporolactobacillus kofuensis TaxID=269672 RepID=A0ABW1WC01_9BACL|nr:NRAMP family divalent metal transporter [Sporolactobacillus kofuensis]MCO7175152.1 divalent metal cation transporter [Sporolactobacillus kofuensis]